MRNVLVTSAGRRVSLVRAFQAELGRAFPGAKVFAADMAPELSSACRVADDRFVVPAASSPDYPRVLLDLCRQHGVGLVIPTIDTELLPLAAAKDDFYACGVHVVVSSPELVGRCRDKRLTAGFFSEHGVSSPEIFSPESLRFPCFAKPLDGSRSQNLHVIRSASAIPPGLLHDEKMIFMELVDKAKYREYTIDMYFDRGGSLRSAVPRRRIEVRDGEVSKAVTEKGVILPFIRKHFSHVDGAVGCITLQLFKHCELAEFLGIEVNPRFGGGYPLSYLAGANFPGWLMQEYLGGGGVADYDDWEEDLLMLRYDAEVLVHGFSA